MDFLENGLKGVLDYYSGSPFRALKDAGYDIKEYEMDKVPQGYWKKKENRVKAIRGMVDDLGKKPTEITRGGILINGLITNKTLGHQKAGRNVI